MSDENSSYAVMLGEVKGQLVGISDLIKQSNAATHQRIADLSNKLDAQTQAINARINDHKAEVDQRFDDHKGRLDTHETRIGALEGQRTRTRIEGAGAATLVAGTVEILKRLFG